MIKVPTPKQMIESDKTARQLFYETMANPSRKKFGFGKKLAIVNVDLQQAYTSGEFITSYQTHPQQLDFINQISDLARVNELPVIWTHVAYMESAADAGVWGTRTDTEDSLQNIKFNSARSKLDPRLQIDRTLDAIYTKRMPSAFFETPLQSLLIWHKIDTVVITGGSTSGCVRATAVDALSRGYSTIIPQECVADKHESFHFANLTDLALKYADVVSVKEVIEWCQQYGVHNTSENRRTPNMASSHSVAESHTTL